MSNIEWKNSTEEQKTTVNRLYCLVFFYHSYGYVTITSEGLQNLTYARHSSPLNREGRTTEIAEKLYTVSSGSKYCGAATQRHCTEIWVGRDRGSNTQHSTFCWNDESFIIRPTWQSLRTVLRRECFRIFWVNFFTPPPITPFNQPLMRDNCTIMKILHTRNQYQRNCHAVKNNPWVMGVHICSEVSNPCWRGVVKPFFKLLNQIKTKKSIWAKSLIWDALPSKLEKKRPTRL